MRKELLLAAGILTLVSASALAQGSTEGHWSGFLPKVQERLAALDGNKNGIITREEVMARADQKFREADKNSDGVISKDEVAAKVDEKFGKIDANADGGITADELKLLRDKLINGLPGTESIP